MVKISGYHVCTLIIFQQEFRDSFGPINSLKSWRSTMESQCLSKVLEVADPDIISVRKIRLWVNLPLVLNSPKYRSISSKNCLSKVWKSLFRATKSWSSLPDLRKAAAEISSAMSYWRERKATWSRKSLSRLWSSRSFTFQYSPSPLWVCWRSKCWQWTIKSPPRCSIHPRMFWYAYPFWDRIFFDRQGTLINDIERDSEVDARVREWMDVI